MQLSFNTYGSGPPLGVLHGLFGSKSNWQFFAKVWAERHQVFCIDQRNHGASPHDPVMDYEAMAKDVYETFLHEGIDRSHLLGHSMGGKTAMYFACLYPACIDRLIVVDIAPKYYPPQHQHFLEALLGLPLAKLQSRSEAELLLASAIPEKQVRQFLLKNLKRGEKGVFRWKLNLEAIQANYTNINQGLPKELRYEGPTLFIRGERSQYISNEDEDMIRHHFPKAEIVRIEGAGHWVHADKPTIFLQTVDAFLT